MLKPKCLICNNNLHLLKAENSPYFYRCYQHGIWTNLNYFLKNPVLKPFGETLLKLRNTQPLTTENKRWCPQCAAPLIKTFAHEDKLIMVDQCFSCNGIWFDNSEFQNLTNLKSGLKLSSLHSAAELKNRTPLATILITLMIVLVSIFLKASQVEAISKYRGSAKFFAYIFIFPFFINKLDIIKILLLGCFYYLGSSIEELLDTPFTAMLFATTYISVLLFESQWNSSFLIYGYTYAFVAFLSCYTFLFPTSRFPLARRGYYARTIWRYSKAHMFYRTAPLAFLWYYPRLVLGGTSYTSQNARFNMISFLIAIIMGFIFSSLSDKKS